MLTFSNPRKSVVIEDWPSGSKRVTARFSVETDKYGRERAIRETTGKPKKMTYARKVLYVDGSDGRLYFIELAAQADFFTVMKGTFNYQEKTVFANDPEYATIKALFDEVNS